MQVECNFSRARFNSFDQNRIEIKSLPKQQSLLLIFRKSEKVTTFRYFRVYTLLYIYKAAHLF